MMCPYIFLIKFLSFRR